MKGKPCNRTQKNPRRPGIAVIWGYLGLANRLNGCGGGI